MDKRQQVEDREQFTDQQKEAISAKSNYRCAYCGKKVYIGYGGTIDHFVPLKKGGTNDSVNLVLMCFDCNQSKGSKVIPPDIGAKYLDEPFRSKLDDYFENFLHQFSYVSRGNLMACDIYELYCLPTALATAQHKANRKGKKLNVNLTHSVYTFTRAYPEDEERIVQYYIKYLVKYKMLGSEEIARQNIKLWMRFGVIYFVEKNNDILVFSTALMNRHGYVSINIFSYYSTPLACTIARGIVTCISNAITREHDLVYIPVSVNIIKDDSICTRVINADTVYCIGDRWICAPFYCYNPRLLNDPKHSDLDVKKGKKHLEEFLSSFYDIERKVNGYITINNLDDCRWIANEILERDFFADLSDPKHLLD